MKKPLIAVLPLYDREKDSYWMLPGYFAGLQAAGAVPVMLPLFAEQDTAQLARDFDGFLFTGGQDVDPVLYGEQMLDCCGELNSARDRMEAAMLQELMNLKKPVLGICRGLQLINACLGGTLWQDLPSQRSEAGITVWSVPTTGQSIRWRSPGRWKSCTRRKPSASIPVTTRESKRWPPAWSPWPLPTTDSSRPFSTPTIPFSGLFSGTRSSSTLPRVPEQSFSGPLRKRL